MKHLLFFVGCLLVTLTGCSQCSDCGELTSEQLTPPDFAEIANTQQKKVEFFEYLYPLTKEANRQVLEEKQQLRSWAEQSDELSERQINHIADTAKFYKVECETADKTCALNIHRKIGMVPPSLVLAQAANESAWGTSRFAVDGNNYFGQWCYSKGCGIKPSQRDTGASHEVKEFDNAFASVKSYIHNLNTSAAYKQLRQTRREAWRQNRKPNGVMLAKGLTKYSERGADYVTEIQHMIRFNSLLEFDEIFWSEIENYGQQPK
ncbi:MAG: glucosaminidase domain-containing protein [Bermanella sp.]